MATTNCGGLSLLKDRELKKGNRLPRYAWLTRNAIAGGSWNTEIVKAVCTFCLFSHH